MQKKIRTAEVQAKLPASYKTKSVLFITSKTQKNKILFE